jgi:glucokinase
VARLGEWLLAPARDVVRQRCHVTPLDRVQVVRAALGSDAGVVGAAVWAFQQAQDTGTTR